MTTGPYRRRNTTLRQVVDRRSQRENNFFLAIIGFSLLVHSIVAAIFLHSPSPAIPHRPPTLSVELVMAPVANPQRGSASASPKIAAPVAVQKEPVLPPKAIKKEPVVVTKDKPRIVKDDEIRADIAKMKQRLADQAEAKRAEDAIAAMRKKTAAPPQKAMAAGSATGTGDEAGSAIGEWLQQAVREKWSWPDRKRKELSAEVEVEFDIRGRLSNYRFVRHATDSRFDDSLKRALLSLEPLPKALRKPYKERILFNLEDLQP